MGRTLSVIVVTYNSGPMVLDCLRSALEDDSAGDAEVIVVDNASDDGTPDLIARAFPHIRLIACEENRGFAAGVNRGLQVADGRYILLLNPDVAVHLGALGEMVGFLDENPPVGIVGPRTYDSDGEIALTARPPYSVATVLWQYLGLSRLFPYLLNGRYRAMCESYAEPFEVGWVQGSCLMFRREVYEQIGGFDEGFFLFAEEADFCDRARVAGWRVFYLPSAAVTHRESSTVSRYVPLKIRSHHISPLYYFRKRGRWGAVWALKMGFTAELVLKSAIRAVQLVSGSGGDAGIRLRSYFATLIEVWRYR